MDFRAFSQDRCKKSLPEGLPLASLAKSQLERRYYSWLGFSGARYVCTVFKAGEEEALSSFTDAAIIGVAQRGGVRRPVCMLQPRDFEGPDGYGRVKAAIALGANEWHVHFSSELGKFPTDIGCQ